MLYLWGFTVCLMSDVVNTAECSFEYRRQPPSTTLRDCNPYDNSNRIVIVLECVVRRMDGISTTFTIRWFRESTIGAVEDLGLGDPIFSQWRVEIGHQDIMTQHYSTISTVLVY